MDKFVISALYAETCERWHKTIQSSELDQWQSNLKDITEDEAREAIESHAQSRWGNRMPYSGTIYKEVLKQRASRPIQSSSLSSWDPYPNAETDNRHFLEWMAAEEGRTPEEMEKHINEFMNEWEKNR